MLNISKQIYYAWNSKKALDTLPEADVIPGGESINEKKKLEKLTKKYPDINEHENNPLPGFTLFKTNRKNFGSSDPTWLVIDPRGFLVRITNENLEEILLVSGITEGLIQEKCVWAREDTQTKLKLIPINSKLYIDAVKNTELLDEKVSIKDVQIGDTVLLQSSVQGIYMGTHSLYGTLQENKNSRYTQTYPRRQILKTDDNSYLYQGDLKILKIIKKADTPLTKEEAVKLMNNDILNPNTYFTNIPNMPGTYYTSRWMIRHVSTKAISSVPLSLEEINFDEATELFEEAKKISDSGVLALESKDGRFYLVDFPYSMSSARLIDINAFTVDEVSFEDKSTVIQDLTDYKERYSYYKRAPKPTYALDYFKKFYKIVKHVKNETYV